MGRYDDIDPRSLENDLVAFARLVIRLQEEDRLLQAGVEIQRLMGDLRQKLFAYEVRSARELGGDRTEEDRGRTGPDADAAEEADPSIRESLRVVREALERQEEVRRQWSGDEPPDDQE